MARLQPCKSRICNRFAAFLLCISSISIVISSTATAFTPSLQHKHQSPFTSSLTTRHGLHTTPSAPIAINNHQLYNERAFKVSLQMARVGNTSPTKPNNNSGGSNNFGRRSPPAPPKEDRPPMNDEISATTLRVVTSNAGGKDEALGIMSKTDALAKAKSMGNLDLILINENSDPPVCRIVDYSKFRYNQEKRAKDLKKMSKATEIKEVKMSYKIDTHDYDVRVKNANKFLKQGNRVKCTVMFRGREVQHDDLGFELLGRLANDLDDVCQKEGRPKREGRNLSLILTPRPEVMKAVNDMRKAEERLKKKKKQEQKKEALEGKMGKTTNGVAVGAAAAAAGVTAASLDDDDEDDSDYSDDSDDEDDSDDDLLDDLLGKDDFTEKLFK